MRRAVGHARTATDGFALAEVILALMLMALLTALALPGVVRHVGGATLQVTAFQISALLREDRNAATSSGRMTTTWIRARGLRSSATGAVVSLPYGDRISGPDRIRFQPDGHATDATLVLASDSARVFVTVNPDTGAIHVSVP